jgi:CubicO group peptidase (beta-lactamase class C family)
MTLTNRVRRIIVILSLIVAPARCVCAAEPVIATGHEDPRLASFDRLMISFCEKHDVPGASLAVAKDGRLVYARGFGFADRQSHEPVQPDSLFRIASVTKPFTATAIMQLVEQGKLKLDDRAFAVLGMNRDATGDPRLKEITINELLHHRGGWDRDKSFDPMFIPIKIAKTFGTEPPANQEQIIRYMLTQPLDFDPGEREAYSNFGYCVLGRVIEKVSGKPYGKYVQEEVLAPLGIHRMRLGHSRLRDRAEHEVMYYNKGTGASVFPPDVGEQVPLQYGAWNIEAMDSHGGWIASATDLVRFGESFNHDAEHPLLDERSIKRTFSPFKGEAAFHPDDDATNVFYGCGWEVRVVDRAGRINTWHTGLLDGTSSILVRRSDGLTWAVLFNASQAPDEKGDLASLIDSQVHGAADEVKEWPKEDLYREYLKR